MTCFAFFVGVVAAGLACLPFVGLAALCDAATSARRERTLALSGLGASNSNSASVSSVFGFLASLRRNVTGSERFLDEGGSPGSAKRH